MLKYIIILLAFLMLAFYPFDTGMHMGTSTGGAGGSFPSSGDKLLIEGTADCILIEGTADCLLIE